MSQIRLHGPAELLSSAPAIFGFVPANSLLIYMLDRTATGDVTLYCGQYLPITTEAVALERLPISQMLAGGVVAAIILAVCEKPHDDNAKLLLNKARDLFKCNDIRVITRLHARNLTEAGRWLDVDTGEFGDTYPYTDAAATAQAVVDGAQIRRSRDDIAADFAHLPPAPQFAAEELATTVDEIAEILTTGTAIASLTLPTRAGFLITGNTEQRNAMIGLAAGHEKAAAELWTFIGRRLRGQARAEALTIAAACLCLDTATVKASIAVAAALAEPDTTAPWLAQLIQAGLQAGITSAEIREALTNVTAPDRGRAAVD